MPSISIYLSDELYTKLVKFAKKKRTTKGAVIRRAIKEYIDRREIKQGKLLV